MSTCPPHYYKHRFFEPRDEKEHERANAGEFVPDYCANCGAPFMEHHNGHCPKDSD